MTEVKAREIAIERIDKNKCDSFAKKEWLNIEEYYEDTVSWFANLILNWEVDNDCDFNEHNEVTKNNFLAFKAEVDEKIAFDKKKEKAQEEFLQELLKINKNYFLWKEEWLIPLWIMKWNKWELLSPIACQIFSVIAYEQHLNNTYWIKPAAINTLINVLKKYTPKKMHKIYENKNFIRNWLKELNNEELIHLDHPDWYFLSYLTFFWYVRV